MKKTTKKSTFIPSYTIDVTNVNTLDDVKQAIASTKLYYYLTNDDINAIIDMMFNALLEDNNALLRLPSGECVICNVNFNTVGNTVVLTSEGTTITVVKKKQNVFKRFWNWITRKK